MAKSLGTPSWKSSCISLVSFSGDNNVRGKLDGPLLHMLNELRREVSGLRHVH